jgi:hypothetical protein
MDLSLSYRYAERDGNSDNPAFNRNIGGVSINYRF